MASGDVSLQVNSVTVQRQDIQQFYSGGTTPSLQHFLHASGSITPGGVGTSLDMLTTGSSEFVPSKLSGAKSYTVKFIEN